MLEIDIRLNPFGSNKNITVIGNIYIANITKLARSVHQDYVYVIYNQESRYNREEIIHGVIHKHDPYQSSTMLLKKILEDYGQSACNLSETYADAIIEVRL